MRVFADTTSPPKKYAFGWRSPGGLPSVSDIPEGVENVLVQLADGAVIAKLGGEYWATGEMRANRYDLLAAWSPDSRAVIEVANSRWDSDAFAYYLMDGATVTKLDLRTLVEAAMKAKLPARKRELYSFRVLDDPPVTLDAGGHARLRRRSLYRRAKPAWTTRCRWTSRRSMASHPRGSSRCSGSSRIRIADNVLRVPCARRRRGRGRFADRFRDRRNRHRWL